MGSALQNIQLLQVNLMTSFHSVAPAIQSKVKISCKSFNDYLPSKNYVSFTITLHLRLKLIPLTAANQQVPTVYHL